MNGNKTFKRTKITRTVKISSIHLELSMRQAELLANALGNMTSFQLMEINNSNLPIHCDTKKTIAPMTFEESDDIRNICNIMRVVLKND